VEHDCTHEAYQRRQLLTWPSDRAKPTITKPHYHLLLFHRHGFYLSFPPPPFLSYHHPFLCHQPAQETVPMAQVMAQVMWQSAQEMVTMAQVTARVTWQSAQETVPMAQVMAQVTWQSAPEMVPMAQVIRA